MNTKSRNRDLQDLIRLVRWNCRLASAGGVYHYSLCGLLLSLRRLYKWEHGLKPWQEPDPDQVLAWVAEQERVWESLEDAPWRTLTFNGETFEPQEVEEVNHRLLPLGLAYGAGLSRGLRPTFFLGELTELRRQEELTIFVLGPELARDLDGTPAMCQGSLIYARQETLAFYLWDHLADPVQQNNDFLKIALAGHRLTLKGLLRKPGAHEPQFQEFLAGELEAVIHHEIGEAREPSLRQALPAVIAAFPQTRAERWARGLKDALADVNEWGRLNYLIETRNLSSLALMMAWRPGLYPLLMPELDSACRRVASQGDWEALEETRLTILARLRRTAQGLTALMASRDPANASVTLKAIEQQYLAPLGL
ncbi:MAG: Sfum_1244 family protein [Thermodesulfobacteriota bacterium]